MSLHCKQAPFQYQEYEIGLLRCELQKKLSCAHARCNLQNLPRNAIVSVALPRVTAP